MESGSGTYDISADEFSSLIALRKVCAIVFTSPDGFAVERAVIPKISWLLWSDAPASFDE
jgi:hypothetical protein